MDVKSSLYPNPKEGLGHMMKACDGDGPAGTRTIQAVTRLKVLQRGMYEGQPATKLLLQPITG